MYAPTVIRECQHSSEMNTFYKGLFRAAIREMTGQEFNQFCTEVLQLYHYHEATVGKWCTDMPQLFRDHARYFYKIPFPVADDSSDNPIDHFLLISQCKTLAGKYDKQKFSLLLEEAKERDFYFFCNHILQLDLHRAFAQTLWYTDSTKDLARVDGRMVSDILSPLSGVQWDSPLYFRVRKK